MQINFLSQKREKSNQDPNDMKGDQSKHRKDVTPMNIHLSSIAERIKTLAAKKRESMHKQKQEKEEPVTENQNPKESQKQKTGDEVTETIKSFQKNRKEIQSIDIDQEADVDRNSEKDSEESLSPTTAPNRKLKTKRLQHKQNKRRNAFPRVELPAQPKGYSHLFTGKFDKSAIESAIRHFQEKQRILDLEIQKLSTQGKKKMKYRTKNIQQEVKNNEKTTENPKQKLYQRENNNKSPDLMKQWLQRRRWELKRKTDLTVLSLDELVEQAHNRGIISTEIRLEYVSRSTQANILEFITLFIKGKSKNWNYKSIKITILDHRRIVQNLLDLYPSSYCVGPPIALQPQINDFLINLYNLSAEDYTSLLKHTDSVSGITFWQAQMIKIVQSKKRTIEDVYFSTTKSNNRQDNDQIPRQEERLGKNNSNITITKKNMMKKSSKFQAKAK